MGLASYRIFGVTGVENDGRAESTYQTKEAALKRQSVRHRWLCGRAMEWLSPGSVGVEATTCAAVGGLMTYNRPTSRQLRLNKTKRTALAHRGSKLARMRCCWHV